MADEENVEIKPDPQLAALAAITEQLKTQGEALAALTNRLDTPAAKAAPVIDEEIEYVPASKDPGIKQVMDAIKPFIDKQARSAASSVVENDREEGRVLNGLKAEYPELADKEHALTKEALRIFKALPQPSRNAQGMELAALRAASNLGVTPMSKRSREEDDFVIGGGSKPVRAKRNKDEGEELDGAQQIWAEQLELDPKKVAQRASRSNWTKYEAPARKK